MSKHYERHVDAVVNAFLELVDDRDHKLISQEHVDELSMLIESAISTAVLEQLEQIAGEVSGLAKAITKRAERYDQ